MWRQPEVPLSYQACNPEEWHLRATGRLDLRQTIHVGSAPNIHAGCLSSLSVGHASHREITLITIIKLGTSSDYQQSLATPLPLVACPVSYNFDTE